MKLQMAGEELIQETGSLISRRLPSDGNRLWSIITPPSIEPVTLEEVKSFCRIEYSEEDSLLNGFIVGVRQATEEYLGRALLEQTIKLTMDYWPSTQIRLPRPPVISITKVSTLDEDNLETEYASSSYYLTNNSSTNFLVLRQGVTAPSNSYRDYGGFAITYKSGYGAVASSVPQVIKEGIKLWVANFQATRFFDPKKPPPEAKGLLDLYRLARLTVR